MPTRFPRSLAAFVPALLLLSACGTQDGPTPAPSAQASDATGAPPAATETEGLNPFVADPVEDEPGFPTSFRALGTEPFWALHVSDERMRYSTPEDQEGQSVPFTREVAADREVMLKAELDGKPLVLTGRIAECSDGMSDREYPFTVELRIGNEIRKGCGRPIEP